MHYFIKLDADHVMKRRAHRFIPRFLQQRRRYGCVALLAVDAETAQEATKKAIDQLFHELVHRGIVPESLLAAVTVRVKDVSRISERSAQSYRICRLEYYRDISWG